VEELTTFLRQHGMSVPPELAALVARDTVVMVEDDPNFRSLVARALEHAKLDIDLVQAATGVDGLLEIGRVQPSLIVLDFKLPDLNAQQLIERLLEPRRRLEAEIIVVTGGLSKDDEAGLRRMGVKTIVDKEDGLPAVVEAIRQALERRVAA
jgi:DNA-binding response OmpR family regulator